MIQDRPAGLQNAEHFSTADQFNSIVFILWFKNEENDIHYYSCYYSRCWRYAIALRRRLFPSSQHCRTIWALIRREYDHDGGRAHSILPRGSRRPHPRCSRFTALLARSRHGSHWPFFQNTKLKFIQKFKFVVWKKWKMLDVFFFARFKRKKHKKMHLKWENNLIIDWMTSTRKLLGIIIK